MKEIIDVINEEQVVNESSIFSIFDISLVALLSSTISFLISVGCGVTGQVVRAMVGSKNRDRYGKEKVEILQEFKNFVRELDFDVDDIPQAKEILNNPGEWTTEMCAELRNAFYKKMNPAQRVKYDEFEKKYIKLRNKFAKF